MEETHAPVCYYGGVRATLRIMTVPSMASFTRSKVWSWGLWFLH